jgi:hypothetical protein
VAQSNGLSMLTLSASALEAMLAHEGGYLLGCLQHAAKQGTRICFHTTRDPTKAVMLPSNLLEFGENILPYDNAHFAAIPAGATSSYLYLQCVQIMQAAALTSLQVSHSRYYPT